VVKYKIAYNFELTLLVRMLI